MIRGIAVIDVRKAVQRDTEQVLSTLIPREERVLKMRFGLEDGTEYTLEEVGQDFVAPPASVSARLKLRHFESCGIGALRVSWTTSSLQLGFQLSAKDLELILVPRFPLDDTRRTLSAHTVAFCTYAFTNFHHAS